MVVDIGVDVSVHIEREAFAASVERLCSSKGVEDHVVYVVVDAAISHNNRRSAPAE